MFRYQSLLVYLWRKVSLAVKIEPHRWVMLMTWMFMKGGIVKSPKTGRKMNLHDNTLGQALGLKPFKVAADFVRRVMEMKLQIEASM